MVARRIQQFLQENPIPGVQAFDCGTGGMDVMFQARGSTALIIIDASRTGSEPGAVYRVPGEVLAQLPEAGYTLHDFRWDHAIAAGRKIYKDDFPEDVTVYLIEAENLGFGLELSEPVAGAAEKVVGEIVERLRTLI